MGRCKDYSYEQTVFLPINFSRQVLPGTFEYTLHNLIDNELDVSIFEERIHNEGASKWKDSLFHQILRSHCELRRQTISSGN